MTKFSELRSEPRAGAASAPAPSAEPETLVGPSLSPVPAAPERAAPEAAPAPRKPVVAHADGRSGRPVAMTHDLAWPKTVDGVHYDRIVRRRPTVSEVADYVARWLAAPAAEVVRFPVFYTPDGAPVPDAVMNALDPDDDEVLMEGVDDFLPARLLRLKAARA